MRQRERIIECALFESFPNSPEASDARNLHALLERVIATHRADAMPAQKCDTRKLAAIGFEERYWSPVNIHSSVSQYPQRRLRPRQ
jgi:hypothetical protein